MKTQILLLAIIVAAISFGPHAKAANPTEKDEAENTSLKMELEFIETLSLDECVSCPVNVQIFDQDFNLVFSGEMNLLQETNDMKLEELLHQSNLLIESNGTLIYQLEN